MGRRLAAGLVMTTWRWMVTRTLEVMRRLGRLWLVTMASGTVAAGCGGDDGEVQASATETDPSTSTTNPNPTTTVAATDTDASTGVDLSESDTLDDTTTGVGTGSSTTDSTSTTDASSSGSSGSGSGSSSDGSSSSSGGSSSGTTAEGSSSSGEIDPSVGFIAFPDGGSVFECSPWEQDCPEGEKCMPWADDGGNSWNALRCSPLDPTPAAVGDACTVEGSGVSGIDDCDLGAMCWAVDPETNQGTCLAFCTGTPDAPACDDPTTQCTIENGGVLILCLPSCDPLLQDCADGDECIPSNDTFVCVVDSSEDFGGAGDPCEYLNVCDPGLMCAAAELVPNCNGASGCCTPFCDVTDAGASMDCANTVGIEAECLPYFEEGQAPPGYEDVGVCGIPA